MSVRASGSRVLVVDDEPALRQTLSILLKRAGYEPVGATGHRQALEALASSPEPFPVVLTDLSMPDGSGLDVLAAAKSRSDFTQVVLITAHSTVENALEAMRGGAYDFVTKPFDAGELSALIQKAFEKYSLVAENAALRAQVASRNAHGVIGRSAAMRDVFDLVERIAPSRTSVLISGESGTGKEKVAESIHRSSERKDGPFLVVNCGALPENLMESELFGHEKGSFTGASERTLGMFREAEGGTLFLDEIGELPLPLQVKLLRVLQERKVRPVGSTKEVPVDVRVLAATNRDIEAEVQAERFRQDLYYRINVIRLVLPPLRERREDIPFLAEAFLQRFSREQGKEVLGLTPDALRALSVYDFPGNVRELENMMERGVALAGSPRLGLGDLPPSVSGLAAAPGPGLLELPADGCRLDEVVSEVERRLVVAALERTGGVRTHAAKLLGITFRSLRYRLQKHALESGEDGDEVPPSSPDGEPA
ncbi:MAG TPA: sigma-54 dependent transcriptional regulator [Polyangiaceae bacterium]|nr:sigma-54 dependent transcriptional regulator [Polyangiaceae bacterium]